MSQWIYFGGLPQKQDQLGNNRQGSQQILKGRSASGRNDHPIKPKPNLHIYYFLLIHSEINPKCLKFQIYQSNSFLSVTVQTTWKIPRFKRIFVGSQECQKSSHFQLHNFKFKEIALFYNFKNSSGILIINQYIWHVNDHFVNLLYSHFKLNFIKITPFSGI